MVHRKAAAAAVTKLHVRTEKPNLASPVTQAAEQVAAVRQFWKAFQNRVQQMNMGKRTCPDAAFGKTVPNRSKRCGRK